MTVRRLEARGPASVEEVWDRYTTPARWPEWSPRISRVEALSPSTSSGEPLPS